MNDVVLFTASLAVTVLGLLASWRAYRSRGAASGLRGAAWSLVPLGFYLTGLTQFLTSLVFSPMKWAGVVVLGVAAACYLASGVKLRRAVRTRPRQVEPGGRQAAPPVRGGRSGTAGMDDDMSDIEEILRRRGI